MKFNRFFHLLTLTVIPLLVLASGAPAEETVLARVGSVPVTPFEVEQKLQQLMPLKGGFHGNVRAERVDEMRAEALQEMIGRAYLVQYGIQQGVAVDKDEMEAELQRVRKKFKNDGEMQAAIGGDLATLRAAIYRKFLAAKAEQLFLVGPSMASDQEALRYYEKNKARFMRPKSFRAQAIYLKVDPNLTEEEQEMKRQQAEELVAKAKAGEDFFNLAYYNSDHDTRYVGGDTGYFHQGQMRDKEMERILIGLKPGEIAGPIQNIFGYHIVKLTEMKDEKQLTFDEIKDKIKTSLEKEKREQLSEKLMGELKAQYPVTKLAGAIPSN